MHHTRWKCWSASTSATLDSSYSLRKWDKLWVSKKQENSTIWQNNDLLEHKCDGWQDLTSDGDS